MMKDSGEHRRSGEAIERARAVGDGVGTILGTAPKTHNRAKVKRLSKLLIGKEFLEPPAGIEPATC